MECYAHQNIVANIGVDLRNQKKIMVQLQINVKSA